jgi:hypothetical protein
VQVKKWESFETRFPCRAHIRLQANTVTQAWCMHHETPAAPQTAKLSNPFSAPHKWQLISGILCQKQLQQQQQHQRQHQQQKQRRNFARPMDKICACA